MNKWVISFSFLLSIFLLNLGTSLHEQMKFLKNENDKIKGDNIHIQTNVHEKGKLSKRAPVALSLAYGLVMNRIRALESDSGTNVELELEGVKDTQDISGCFVNTSYRGIKGLKIKMLIDHFPIETNMGTLLDDVHLLEKETDFTAEEIIKDNNRLMVKGEIYGI